MNNNKSDNLAKIDITLYHPEGQNGIFQDVTGKDQCCIFQNFSIGRSPKCNLQLNHKFISRRHFELEPYFIKGNPYLCFSLKNLSHKGILKVNGMNIEYLQKTPIHAKNTILFSGFQMLVTVDQSVSWDGYVCEIHVSDSPVIHMKQPEENDESDVI
ncbi:TRAF-interacting protein with FHA domain-containing protein B-like [Erpetoichthys calabaricus]|uniref:TRAF-interacting protein with FHA domain-containing protein B-like n=1 Tax=Erpetoichthys calabaricus TaxID=27687 RepID=UPI0022349E5A|nr:TRAF-interacting protein with FHA domain-containing protein B-like [Erpetoichthys calabaricus]